MSSLENFVSFLPDIDRSAVAGVQLERRISLDGDTHETAFIVLTNRTMTLDGGNGHSGIDGNAVNNIRLAVLESLSREFSGPEMIDEIIIRQQFHATYLVD